MYNRTYGWVQNPANLNNLKLVVQIFDPESKHYEILRDDLVPNLIAFSDLRDDLLQKLNSNQTRFTYTELVGTSRDRQGRAAATRSHAVADGLIQITIRPQNFRTKGKAWTDNWTADGFLRWALSLGLVSHDRSTDLCAITDLGKSFSSSTDSPESDPTLAKAILAYPPASRVLQLLDDADTPVNKFYLGERLGFKGERGFTSYPSDTMEKWLEESADINEQSKIRSDIEGTADKYGRMISGWLIKIGYVKKVSTQIKTATGLRSGFPNYEITPKGRHAYRKSIGYSKNRRLPKYINWEFLAVDGNGASENANRDYIRTRRAKIIEFLQHSKSLAMLEKHLIDLGFDDNRTIILNDIAGLNSIGIRIDTTENELILRDDIIGFSIPDIAVTAEQMKSAQEYEKQELMEITTLPLKYYELLDIARDPKRNRAFELITIELLKEVMGLDGECLGGGRKPDGIIYSETEKQALGVIVDTKAYTHGYGKNISQEDEMVRYIEDNQLRSSKRNENRWWEHFGENVTPDNTFFLWVSGDFKDRFHEQLVSTYDRTGTKGAAISARELLIAADKVKSGQLTPHQFLEATSTLQVVEF
ncbi:restriction endonuclease FokI C-terminal domain-containing protein [Corynebacterium amycolatum]|uniref:Restriction endonuclease FokI C-terminal domain-containing protein n=1 Tax=Corynebacterium amycolatum TaxID=43765 RepID=A0AAW9SVG5_CORAY|nr:restriction endonuclease FokI C-terminal domain-containing protein [Corynebacterium amycolatum]MDK7237744.1 restriction endonuclease FokI C-terminal domain-containing protein [Corynebacterium amycolatum]MDK7247708.1 restriction endonuclease FokI C-terminal domain-containing protein [Corynebacterium amycolatum]